jgi:hypothetical protein
MLLSEFKNRPRERNLIGKMLLAYGELEFAILGCVSQVLNDDIPTTTRILFRVRGETPRISVADAIMRPALAKYPKLRAKWITAYAAANHCKNIRNQYAHCHWQLVDKNLNFIDLDDEAKSSDDPILDMTVTFRPIDRSLLEKQFKYFEYAVGCMYHLRDQLILRSGKTIRGHRVPEPKSIPRPPRDNRPVKDAPSPEEGSGGILGKTVPER